MGNQGVINFKNSRSIKCSACLVSRFYPLDKGIKYIGRFLKICSREENQGLYLLTHGLVCKYLWLYHVPGVVMSLVKSLNVKEGMSGQPEFCSQLIQESTYPSLSVLRCSKI